VDFGLEFGYFDFFSVCFGSLSVRLLLFRFFWLIIANQHANPIFAKCEDDVKSEMC